MGHPLWSTITTLLLLLLYYFATFITTTSATTPDLRKSQTSFMTAEVLVYDSGNIARARVARIVFFSSLPKSIISHDLAQEFMKTKNQASVDLTLRGIHNASAPIEEIPITANVGDLTFINYVNFMTKNPDAPKIVIGGPHMPLFDIKQVFDLFGEPVPFEFTSKVGPIFAGTGIAENKDANALILNYHSWITHFKRFNEGTQPMAVPDDNQMDWEADEREWNGFEELPQPTEHLFKELYSLVPLKVCKPGFLHHNNNPPTTSSSPPQTTTSSSSSCLELFARVGTTDSGTVILESVAEKLRLLTGGHHHQTSVQNVTSGGNTRPAVMDQGLHVEVGNSILAVIVLSEAGFGGCGEEECRNSTISIPTWAAFEALTVVGKVGLLSGDELLHLSTRRAAEIEMLIGVNVVTQEWSGVHIRPVIHPRFPKGLVAMWFDFIDAGSIVGIWK